MRIVYVCHRCQRYAVVFGDSNGKFFTLEFWACVIGDVTIDLCPMKKYWNLSKIEVCYQSGHT